MDTLENLLKRVVKTNKGDVHNPCRICNMPSEATDLCDSCIKEEIEICCDGESGEFLFNAMLKLRECNKKLDKMEEGLNRIESKLC